MAKMLRMLIIEDSEDDAELIARQLRASGYDLTFKRVDTPDDLKDSLHSSTWDLVISDYSLPGFSGFEALRLLKNSGLDLPFILVSGTIGEDLAVEAMKAGAHDYIMKKNLSRLVPAIEREIREAMVRTDHKKVEFERVQLLAKLGEALRSRDDFISIASHELKTPLTPLKLQVQMLRRWVDQEKSLPSDVLLRIKSWLVSSEKQIDRLNDLVDNLLDVSRIRAGRFEMKKQKTNLTHLANEVLERYRDQVDVSNGSITFVSEADIIGNVDPLRMEEVITNLLTNAIKYGAGKPIKITISSNGMRAKIVFQDSGIGIAKEDQSRIFNRFERAAPESFHSGLGLGLYITREILRAHGGTIEVKSEMGIGSTFTVEIPLT